MKVLNEIGKGNFSIYILSRKLRKGHKKIERVKNEIEKTTDS